jgi:phosphoribosyl-ATP pyrophosphohydrolase
LRKDDVVGKSTKLKRKPGNTSAARVKGVKGVKGIKGLKTKKLAKTLRVVGPLDTPSSQVDTDVAVRVLNRLWSVVMSRRTASPAVSHSARLLSRGTAKVAQKFGEEAVECLIEAVCGNRDALVAESADVLYHLIVLWVSVGISPHEVWEELMRREGISGIAEKAARARELPIAFGLATTKIP